jgi:hypothetical protein
MGEGDEKFPVSEKYMENEGIDGRITSTKC